MNLLIFQYIDPHTVKDNKGHVDGEQYLIFLSSQNRAIVYVGRVAKPARDK